MDNSWGRLPSAARSPPVGRSFVLAAGAVFPRGLPLAAVLRSRSVAARSRFVRSVLSPAVARGFPLFESGIFQVLARACTRLPFFTSYFTRVDRPDDVVVEDTAMTSCVDKLPRRCHRTGLSVPVVWGAPSCRAPSCQETNGIGGLRFRPACFQSYPRIDGLRIPIVDNKSVRTKNRGRRPSHSDRDF